jgi:stage II sporulation protein D
VRSILVVLLLAGASARAEEIRIEIARGARAARVESGGRVHRVSVRGAEMLVDGAPGPAQFGGPLKLDGRELAGRLELFADKGALVAVNVVDLEDYVAAVVASEVPPSWPAAALQAQAVAARTYAVAQKIAQGPGARAHLGASVLDQVYAGAAHPASSARKAAQATVGEVLTFGAAPIAAYFSSSCGGRGESGEAAFNLPPGSAPYLTAGDDGDADRGAPRLSWTLRVPLSELSAILRKARRLDAAISRISVAKTTASSRAAQVRLETSRGAKVLLSGAELRQLLGYLRLPSLLFRVEVERGIAVFHGHGSGHGAGLCQWGARGRALRGDGYRDILAHYSPGAELRRMY